MIEIEKYENHDIVKNGGEYRIIWDRGKKYFGYNVTESLAEKSRKSDKDALEVMFYLENKRWPKEYELENYNKSNIKKTCWKPIYNIWRRRKIWNIIWKRKWRRIIGWRMLSNNKRINGKSI